MPERPDEPPFDSGVLRPEHVAIEPLSIDEARLQMCAQLHEAMYGGVWARPESPAVVWAEMLDRIECAARMFHR